MFLLLLLLHGRKFRLCIYRELSDKELRYKYTKLLASYTRAFVLVGLKVKTNYVFLCTADDVYAKFHDDRWSSLDVFIIWDRYRIAPDCKLSPRLDRGYEKNFVLVIQPQVHTKKLLRWPYSFRSTSGL